jgi:YHS domain-containing protein
MIKSPIALFVSALTVPLVAAVLLLAPMAAQPVLAKTPVASLNLSQSGLALRGYDPVAYFKVGKPVKGSKDIAVLHGGGTYYFLSEDNKAAFQSNPAKYLPEYGGFCSYGAAANYKVDGDPKVWNIVNGKLYLNINKSIDRAWDRKQSFYIKKADKNWPKIKDR